MNEEMLVALEEAYLDAVGELVKLPAGSEERLRQTKIVEMLGKLRIEDWKAEMDGMDASNRRDIDRFRMKEDLEIRKEQNQIEKKKMRIRPDTIIGWAATGLLTVGVCVFESSGHIFPKVLTTFIQKPKI